MKHEWIFERFNDDLYIVKGEHSIPVEFRKNSIVAHGTISMLISVSTDDLSSDADQPGKLSPITWTFEFVRWMEQVQEHVCNQNVYTSVLPWE